MYITVLSALNTNGPGSRWKVGGVTLFLAVDNFGFERVITVIN